MRVQVQVVVLFFMFGCLAWAGPHRGHEPAPDLFDSFRQLDEYFSNVDAEFRELQQSVEKSASHRKVKTSWRQAARSVRKSSAQIEAISSRMASHYRRSGRKFGDRSFARLRVQAHRLNADMLKVSGAKSVALARRETALARRALLDLVLQYQALSGGYTAARCGPGTWICGTAKPQLRKGNYPENATRWTCAPRANSCKGLLGPRAPDLAPEALTAVR